MFGSVQITNSTLYGNLAQGGIGQSGSHGGNAFGAALFNLNGTLNLINDTLAANTVLAGTAPAPPPMTFTILRSATT